MRALFRKTSLARHGEGKENLVAAQQNFVDLRKSQSAELTVRGKQIISRLSLDKQSFLLSLFGSSNIDVQSQFWVSLQNSAAVLIHLVLRTHYTIPVDFYVMNITSWVLTLARCFLGMWDGSSLPHRE